MPLRVHAHYTPVPKSKRPSLCSPTTPPGSTAKECSGIRAAKPTFSPSTRYRDLALGPSLFHWESQSTTTEPFRCLGFANYESHEGERPMAIRWRLERPIPAAWLPVMALVG